MSLSKLKVAPGINKQSTEYGAEGQWIDCDNVRFRYGKPEKIGGWEKFKGQVQVANPLESATFLGSISNIHSWNDREGSPYMIVGTSKKLYAYKGGEWADITPLRPLEGTLLGWGRGAWNFGSYGGQVVNFSTVANSDLVTVRAEGHGAFIGDYIILSNTTGTPGGIPNDDLNGEFEIVDVASTDTFVIKAKSAAATTQDITVGDANIILMINVGTDVGAVDYGWNVGTWNEGSWNTPRSTVTNEIRPRIWKFSPYEENVICHLIGGAVYLFDSALGINTRATPIDGAPTESEFTLTAPSSRQLICFGTLIQGSTGIGHTTTKDPMLIRFSDTENPGDFNITQFNFAGAIQITSGSKIVSAVQSRNQIIVLTDQSAYGMQFVGGQEVFAVQQIGANCGCVAPLASAEVNGLTFWMSKDSFYIFDGTVKKMPCSVEDYVFDDINFTQAHKFHAGINSKFNEVSWWYCSTNSDFIDRVVTYNYIETLWSIGTLDRTAWNDSGAFDFPVGGYYSSTDTSNTFVPIQAVTPGRSILYNHEKTVNADGQPITAFLQSGYMDIADGEQVMFMKRFIPDFKEQVGSIDIQLIARKYPNAEAKVSVTDLHNLLPTTEKVDTRIRGRQISLKLTSSNLDTNWRLGDSRIDSQPDGLR